MAAACTDLPCSPCHLQGREQQSCHCLCSARRKGSCPLALCILRLLSTWPLITLRFPPFSPQFPGFVFPAHLKFSCTSPSILVRLHRFLDVQLLPVHGSSSKLIPAVFIPSPGGSFHTFLFPVSLLLALRCHPGSLERARKETDGAAVLAGDGGAGHVPCHGNECCVLALVASSPQSHALTLLLCPHRRRCSCTAASSCAGRWTRPRAAPRAAGDARAGRPSNGSRRRRRNLLTWQTTS